MEKMVGQELDDTLSRPIRFGEKRAGWVADYCTMCRDVQAHELIRGRRDPQGQVPLFAACSVCGVRRSTQADRYLAISPAKMPTIADLVRKTFPRLPLAVYNRARLDLDAVNGRLPLPERAETMREGIVDLHYLMPKRRHWLLWPVLWFLSTVICTAIVGNIPDPNTKQLDIWRVIALLGIFVLPVVIVGVVWWYPGRRFRRDRRTVIIPAVVRSLRPLKPTVDELEAVQAWLASTGNPMARVFQTRVIYEQVKSARDESLTHVHELNFFQEAERMHAELTALRQQDKGPAEPGVEDGSDAT